jgi:uncharacterized protein
MTSGPLRRRSTTVPLFIFAKAPRPGRVKTRLSPPLTPDEAAAIHQASLFDVVRLARAAHGDVRLRHDDPPGSAAYFARVFPDLEQTPQGDGDLGRRLERAFDDAFAEDAAAAAIIGSDSPTLPADTLTAGLDAVLRHDVVLGPAPDGGYYFIGVRREAWPRARRMLEDISWSTDRVLRETLARLAGAVPDVELLPPWYDIDRFDDLRLAAAHAEPGSHLARLIADGLGKSYALTVSEGSRA